jgi:hypothetical protein
LTRNRQKFFDFQEEKHTLPLQPPTTTITTTTKKKFLYIFCFVLFHPSFLFEKKGKILRSSTISVDFFRHKEKYHKYKREKGQQQTNNTHKK